MAWEFVQTVRSWLHRHYAAAPIIGLLTATMIAVFLVLRFTASFAVDVGAAGDGLFLRNFFPPEQAADGETFRWSEPDAQLLVPDPNGPQVLGLRLHTDASRLDPAHDAQLELNLANGEAADIALQPGWRVYEVLLPPLGNTATPVQQITLTINAIQQGARALGVPIDRVYTRPLSSTLLESLVVALLFTWRLGLTLWTAQIVLTAFQPADKRLPTAANLLLGLAAAAAIVIGSWQAPFALGWALSITPGHLALGTLIIAIIQVGINAGHLSRCAARRAIRGARTIKWHSGALLTVALLAIAHLGIFAAVSPTLRALSAWLILLLPGALLTRLALPARGDPLLSGWMMLCGGLVINAALLLALAAIPGPLTLWMTLVAFNSLSLGAGWRLLTRASAASPITPAPSHPLAALAIIMILAAALRLTMLGTPEMHVDEARVLLAATAVVGGNDGALFIRDKGPVEVLLVSGPLALSGQLNEFSGRLPFALAGLGVVLGVYLLARALWHGANAQAGVAVGLLAAALLAVDGLMVGFARTIQYQSIIALLTIAAIWCTVQLEQDYAPARTLLLAGALCCAIGLLAHYDTIYIAPALLAALFVVARRRSFGMLARAAAPAATTGALLLAGFFVPFALHPRFNDYTLRYLSGRVGATREGLGLVNNLSLYEPLVTFYNAAIPVYLIAALLTAGGILWLTRYARPRLLGIMGAALLLTGYAIQLLRPEWFLLADGTNSAAFFFIAPFLLVFARQTPLALRLLLLWFGAIFVSHAFLITIPNTHFFTMHIPAALLTGWALVSLGRGIPAAARHWLTAGAQAVFAALIIYAMVYANILFIRQTPEYVRTYPAARPPFYPTSYGDELPIDQGYYGFPRQDGWKAIGELYQRGILQGGYGSNQKPEVTGWYTQGQPRCETAPRYYFLTYRESYILPKGYYLFGYVRVADERVIAIYRDTYVDAPPRDYDAESALAADARSVNRFAIAGAMGEFLPQYSLRNGGPLLGYDADLDALTAGKATNIAVYWDAARGMDEPPALELTDATGQPVGEVQLICPAEPAERWRETTLRVAWWQVTPPSAPISGGVTLQVRAGDQLARLR